MISKILALFGMIAFIAATVSLAYNITGIDSSSNTLELYAAGCVLILPACIGYLWKTWKEVKNNVDR